jgi:hypothetical protein
MPENIKDNDTQPTRSTEPDLDFRIRLMASRDVSEYKRANRSLHIIAEETARPLVTNSSGHWQDARPRRWVRVMPLSQKRSLRWSHDLWPFGTVRILAMGSPIVFRARPASGLRRVTSALDRIEELSSFGPVD